MARETSNPGSGAMDRLKAEAWSLVGALGDRAVSSVRDRVEGATGRLTEYVEGGGGPGVMAALTGARNLAEGKSPGRSMFGAGFAGLKEKVTGMFRKGGKGGGSRKLKLTHIAESIDVGVPRTVAYNQWTQYSDFSKFTKKVESVDRNKNEENKTNWKAQVFWSHRTWEATVIEQVPDDRIIWRSKGQKGHVDGAVTFHEVTPNLTRILLVLEYHPQGLFERTGNLWRAQGRRARLELKHFRRHMMTEGILHADDLEGWRGTIHDGEVVESHEDAVAREEKEGPQQDKSRQSRQSGNGRIGDEARDDVDEREEATGDDEVRDEADEREEATGDDEVRDEADEREEATGDDDERAGRDDDERGSRNGRTARAGERSGTRRASPPRTRRPAGTGNERRRRTGAATQRGG
jgi:Polyketide cyclase / dehydrase and lipid transport